MKTNLTKSTNNDESVFYYIPSIIFNTNKSFKLLFKIPLLIVLVIFAYIYFNISFIYLSLFLLTILLLSILSAPRKLSFKEKELQYHIFWKIKWSEIIDMSYDKMKITFKLKNGRHMYIKKVSKEDFNVIKKLSFSRQ